jgi:hypothetical protein
MTPEAQKQLFEDIGYIKGQLKSIQENDKAQWAEIKELRKGVNTNNSRIAGISSSAAVVISVGIHYLKQTFGGSS